MVPLSRLLDQLADTYVCCTMFNIVLLLCVEPSKLLDGSNVLHIPARVYVASSRKLRLEVYR